MGLTRSQGRRIDFLECWADAFKIFAPHLSQTDRGRSTNEKSASEVIFKIADLLAYGPLSDV